MAPSNIQTSPNIISHLSQSLILRSWSNFEQFIVISLLNAVFVALNYIG